MNLELWFQRFYQHLNGVPEVIVSSGVTPVGITEGPYEGKPNPHAWMSPDNALIYVDNIRDALIKYDPANAQTYQRNADTYKAKITQTLAPLRKQIKISLITTHLQAYIAGLLPIKVKYSPGWIFFHPKNAYVF